MISSDQSLTNLPYRSAHNHAQEAEYVATDVPLIVDTSLKKLDLTENADPEEYVSINCDTWFFLIIIIPEKFRNN